MDEEEIAELQAELDGDPHGSSCHWRDVAEYLLTLYAAARTRAVKAEAALVLSHQTRCWSGGINFATLTDDACEICRIAGKAFGEIDER